MKNITAIAGPLLALGFWLLDARPAQCFYNQGGCARASAPAPDGAAIATPPVAQEYGPFGEVIHATGPMAKASPFWISTKYQDDETDLLYYGYRYYNASMGRWLNRDPLHEVGSRPWQAITAAVTAAILPIGFGTPQADSAPASPTLPHGVDMNDTDAAFGDDLGLNLYLFVDNRPMLAVDAIGTGLICRCRIPSTLPRIPWPDSHKCSKWEDLGHHETSRPFRGHCVNSTSNEKTKNCPCWEARPCTFVATFTCIRAMRSGHWEYGWTFRLDNTGGLCLP